ncbi:cytochrome c biogenesis protein CcsA [Achromobacter sp. GG226]|uniref:cytochrome C assembly family protein n=1 Tax=Verticiella alkaliphila TaxID=2779529 RepID=UPI001C0D96C8|nr:cytochrome c biogenesis protein CcsA [Verticiella sp. GG226]MBU4612547.1 cytochrome c biogenesis protein CcsA [Verticiella sp. GG226]
MGIVLHTLAALGYAALAWRPWRALSGHADGVATTPERLGLALVLLVHGVALYQAMLGAHQLRLGLGVALSATFWLGMLVFWLESLIIRVDGVRLLLLPLAALAALMPIVLPAPMVIPHAGNAWLPVHLIMSLAAYAFMTIAALHALLMASADRRLHRPQPSADHAGMSPAWSRLFDAIPPLLVLEQVLFRLIAMGFVLLSLAVVTGSAMSRALDGPWLPFDHKTVFTLLSWATFGVLLLGRWLRGWRGRVAVRYTLAGLVLLLLAYAGSRFVIELLLQR